MLSYAPDVNCLSRALWHILVRVARVAAGGVATEGPFASQTIATHNRVHHIDGYPTKVALDTSCSCRGGLSVATLSESCRLGGRAINGRVLVLKELMLSFP